MPNRSYRLCQGSMNLALVVLASALATLAVAGEPAQPRVTVSGISSGAYLATQAHVALSATIDGAALLAGGPYHCAEGNLGNALGRCISGTGLQAAPLLEATRAAAAAGSIDPIETLAGDRVWLFHGQADAVVNAGVNVALQDFYRALLRTEDVTVVDDIPVAHGWPTLESGNSCGEMGGDFINACDYDAAGALLQALYGELNAPVPAHEEGLQSLDQASLVPDGGSFAATGFAYVPQACAETPAECRLHLVFHGCRQGQQFIADRFARQSGLNEWAESNRIVVLYPQIESSAMNPQGCWDWWGYTGADYDVRSGKQIAGAAALINAWSN